MLHKYAVVTDAGCHASHYDERFGYDPKSMEPIHSMSGVAVLHIKKTTGLTAKDLQNIAQVLGQGGSAYVSYDCLRLTSIPALREYDRLLSSHVHVANDIAVQSMRGMIPGLVELKRQLAAQTQEQDERMHASAAALCQIKNRRGVPASSVDGGRKEQPAPVPVLDIRMRPF